MSAKFWSSDDIERLSTSSTWLKLLHYDSNMKSAVHDERFFLNTEGAYDPKKELLATLKAYDDHFFKSDINNSSALCRFPARYYWLSKELNLPEYKEVNPLCTKLLNWKLLKNTRSLSIVFVSGYLGNPASAFGHSFIKVNQSDNSKDNLFDTTISYGALLPPNYNMPEYIFNGLTGGYEAAYSDKYYYNQDITYSNQEFRDMWEYRLHLTEEKKRLFLFHAWELMGKKNQYFFLNRNCGYKVSEFLSLLYDVPLVDHAYVWYAPIETFYKLEEVEMQSGEPIIDKVIYIPSKQQIIYAQYAQLSTVEKKILSEMIEKKLNKIPLKYSSINKSKQADILDFLLAYRKYSFEKSKTKIDKDIKAMKRALILNRLKLPISRLKKAQPKVKEPITNNNRPSYSGVGLIKERGKDSLLLSFSPFALEEVGYNNFNGDELVVFDTCIKLDEDKVSLRQFDLIRIQRLKTKQLPYDNENMLSWNLNIGMQKKREDDYFIDGGLGYSWEINEYLKLYSMMNFSLHSDGGKYRYRPNMGVYGNFKKLRFDVKMGYESAIEEDIGRNSYRIKSQYRIEKDLSTFLEYDKMGSESLEVGLKWFY